MPRFHGQDRELPIAPAEQMPDAGEEWSARVASRFKRAKL